METTLNETTLTNDANSSSNNSSSSSEAVFDEWILDFSNLDNSPLTTDENYYDVCNSSPICSSCSTLESMLFREFNYLYELFREPVIKRAIMKTAFSLKNRGVESRFSESQEWKELCGFVASFVDLFDFCKERRQGYGYDYCAFIKQSYVYQLIEATAYRDRVAFHLKTYCRLNPNDKSLDSLKDELNWIDGFLECETKIVNANKQKYSRKRGSSVFDRDMSSIKTLEDRLIAKEAINQYLASKTRRKETSELMKSTAELAELLSD